MFALPRPALRPARLALVTVVGALFALAPGAARAADPACGDTITADTTLHADLVNCPGAGLVIGASNITLNLNGHTIDGVGNGVGIDLSFFREGVTVKNGTIRQFGLGVQLLLSDNNSLTRITASGNGEGILLLRSDANVIDRDKINGNGDGVVLRGVVGGGSSKGSDGNTLTRNEVSHNTADGLHLEASTLNRLDRNDVSFNGGDGIQLAGQDLGLPPPLLFTSDSNTLTHNRAFGNAGHGIVLDDQSTSNHLVANNASLNLEGIDLRGDSSFNEVADNVAFGNRDDGLETSSSGRNSLTGNLAWLNAAAGVHIQGGSQDNTVEGNRAVANRVDGILVDPESAGTQILRNTSRKNADDGIDVNSPSTTLTENRANRNRDFGIEAVPGVTDGGGNTAHGNGNPAQCSNVACS